MDYRVICDPDLGAEPWMVAICCEYDAMEFFSTEAEAEAYLAAHPELNDE